MSIKLRYLSALLLVAIIVSASAISMRYVFKAQENDAIVINVAGQQRMLSQCNVYQFAIVQRQNTLPV